MNDDNWKPQLSPDIKLQILDGEAVLLDQSNERVHQLDAVGTRMLEHCDGRRTVTEIVDALLELFDVTEEQLQQDASEFFTQLRSLKVLI